MREEYDFSGGARGRSLRALAEVGESPSAEVGILGNVVLVWGGRSLYTREQPYRILFSSRTLVGLVHWMAHLSGKTWMTPETLEEIGWALLELHRQT